MIVCVFVSLCVCLRAIPCGKCIFWYYYYMISKLQIGWAADCPVRLYRERVHRDVCTTSTEIRTDGRVAVETTGV